MTKIETSSGHLAIITPCLQVRFRWAADHWKHEFISCEGCHSIPRIWSVEGIPRHEDPKYPSGPLYQHLDARIEAPGRALASLSGQSGPHHFTSTLSVEEKHDEVDIGVEVSDRCEAPVEDLVVTFLIEASEGKLTVADNAATIVWHHPECRLVFEAESPATVTASESGMGTIRIQAHASLDPAEHLHRVRYRWRWISLPAHQVWDRDA